MIYVMSLKFRTFGQRFFLAQLCKKKYKPQDSAPQPSEQQLFWQLKEITLLEKKKSLRNEGQNDFYIDQGVLLANKHL